MLAPPRGGAPALVLAMVKRRARRGRPRRVCKRTPSGRASRAYRRPDVADLGTPQLQAKRLALINGHSVELVTSTAGVLHARGLLSERQYRAADKFARVRAACFGAVLANTADAPEASEDRVAHVRQVYEAICRRLSAEQLAAVVALAIGDRPAWAWRTVAQLPLRPPEVRSRDALLDGLDALAGPDG